MNKTKKSAFIWRGNLNFPTIIDFKKYVWTGMKKNKIQKKKKYFF